ncbi:FecCD family ABC transporter permease [Conexibacter stalactiti]|uniref:FecCD family ABC transporter permease n=1 Tax=Conexibacter stalactiti TaxID=1940611 RepID=UPI00384F19ED
MTSGRNAGRAAGLAAALAALALVALLSVSIGTRSIPLDQVWSLVWDNDGSQNALVVHDLRIPRTLLGLLAGAALGAAGALMQGLTRNPLADPGLLGVNAGAAFAVVAGLAWFGVGDGAERVWFAFLGAALAAALVYGIGARGRAAASPVRLALAGTAVTFALLAAVQGIALGDPQTFSQYRFWAVGSLAGRDAAIVEQVAPFIVAGLLLALLLARPLNALALGDELGRALGSRPGRTRAAGALAVTLLCGAATAAAGPIVFVGLSVPHIARAIAGPDNRWVLPYSVVLGPILLLAADTLGRVVSRPAEVQVGIVTAFLGGPVFIALVRRGRVARL